MSGAEEPLTGGNMSQVARNGADVLRTAGPWTPTIHRLLEHLRARGVPGVPEPRGLTTDGRERLEYLPGLVPAYPMPDWIWAENVLVETATLLRRIHDASLDFDRAGAVWQLPASEPDEVICHNDFAPYNLTFTPTASGHDHGLLGVIDWDTASPGSRLWDLSYLAYRLVPLTDPANPDTPSFTDEQRIRRLDRLLGAYGPAEPTNRRAASREPATRTAVIAEAHRRISVLADFTAARADPARNSLARHVVVYRRDLAWLDAALTRLD